MGAIERERALLSPIMLMPTRAVVTTEWRGRTFTDLVKKVSTRLRVLALVTRGTQESASLNLYGTFYDVTVLARSQNE